MSCRLRAWSNSGSNFAPDFVMGDGDRAQYNAVEAVFGNETEYLMCFFHLLTNVWKKRTGLSFRQISQVLHDIYDMHFTFVLHVFVEKVVRTTNVWRTWGDAGDRFATYFLNTWCPEIPQLGNTGSVFWRWSLCHTSVGVCSTNNGVEQFNGEFKKDATERKRLHIPMWIRAAANLIHVKSQLPVQFAADFAPSKTMLSHWASLDRAGVFDIRRGPDGSVLVHQRPFAAHDDFNERDMADCSDARWRQIVLRGAMKHYEHFERADMPVEGWRVDVAAHRCPCALAHKFGFCVHIVAALKKSNLPIPGQVAPVGRFVNRAPRPAPNRGRRGQRRAGQGPRGGGRGVPAQEEVRARPQGYLPGPGRPRMLGGALDIE